MNEQQRSFLPSAAGPTLADVVDALPAALCKQCGEPFTPRSSSGGKAQLFCKSECRQEFHSQRGQRSPTSDDENAATGTQQPPDLKLSSGPLQPVVPQQPAKESPKPTEAEDFDWRNDESIAISEEIQIATAVYRNRSGDVVIRQQAQWPDEDSDPFMIIADRNLQAFIDRLCDIAGILSVGGPEPKRDYAAVREGSDR
jgi:hypothetical protein